VDVGACLHASAGRLPVRVHLSFRIEGLVDLRTGLFMEANRKIRFFVRARTRIPFVHDISIYFGKEDILPHV
jgi:hypothetical protein